MSIKARRKNLRMYSLDDGNLQGNPRLMIRAAIQEAKAPSNPTIGVVQSAICLLAFRIRASSPNVPPMQPIKRDTASGATDARQSEEAGKWRIACHAMIADLDAGSLVRSGLDHSSHCLPSPFAKVGMKKNDYILLARRFPIYVGGYCDETGMNSEDGTPSILSPGDALRVVDNDVQGGMYGTIIEQLDAGMVKMQFRDSELRDLFGGGEGGAGGPGGPAVYDEGFDPDEYVYPGSWYTWRKVTPTTTGLNNTPDASAQANLVKLVKEIFEPLDNAGIQFTISSAYRSPVVNEAVGGAEDSQHMTGLGADLVFGGAPGKTPQQVKLFEEDIPEAINKWHQMIIYEDTNHIHIGAGRKKEKLVHLPDGSYVFWDSYRGILSAYKAK
jgi:hypothetical protein